MAAINITVHVFELFQKTNSMGRKKRIEFVGGYPTVGTCLKVQQSQIGTIFETCPSITHSIRASRTLLTIVLHNNHDR